MPMMVYAESDGTYSIDAMIERKSDGTPCATQVFANALAAEAYIIDLPDEAGTSEIDTWSHHAFSQANVLQAVLNCPEVANADPQDTIVFDTIEYRFPPTEVFPEGRLIEINYETQKKVLEQKLLLANKPSLPSAGHNPDIYKDAENGGVWVNVDPAWYAILVAEHGSLNEFVGPGKNNVLSLKYIEGNIDSLYPKDHNTWPIKANCTSKTAWAEDSDMVNRATIRTVIGDNEYQPSDPETLEARKKAKSNDFYVMGDGDLRFVMWLEIAVDVAVTILTWGGYSVIKGALSLARGTRAFAKAMKLEKVLSRSHDVVRWTRQSNRVHDIERAVKVADKAEDSYKIISNVEKGAEASVKYLTRELKLLKARKTRKVNPKTIAAVEKELEMVTKQAESAKAASQAAKQVHNAQQVVDRFSDTEKTLKNIENEISVVKNNMKNLPKNSQLYRQEQSKLARLTNNAKGAKSQLKSLEKSATKAKEELPKLKNTYSQKLDDVQKLHAENLTQMEKAKDVQKYKDVVKAKRDLAHSVYLMRQGKIAWRANRGLLPVRAFRAAKTLHKSMKAAKNLDKSIKVVRASTSGPVAKISDWLFHSTMKNITRLGKVPAQVSTLRVLAKAAGDMYDKTEVSTGDFTNNIDMKPFLLLGADDLEGYEDVINKGMWLFWTGSSTSAADDDAAYLEAMSFAEKFHQDLYELQDDYDNAACDVDIYVVRPIIRDPGTNNQELYYLFMNEKPWTTHDINNISEEIVTRGKDQDGNETFTVTTPSGETHTQTYNDTQTTTSGSTTAGTTDETSTTGGTSAGGGSDTSTGGGGDAGGGGGDVTGATAYSYMPDVNTGVNSRIQGTLGNIRYIEPRYDGTRIGQNCTPPSKTAGGFSSEIYTSGRYRSHPAFEKAMITKFRTEGECSDEKTTRLDKCGYTCFGVCSKYFPQAAEQGFSRADAEDIAWNSFYKKYKIDKLPDAISGDVFMALWGTGSKNHSIGLLQRILGVKDTGYVNEETIEAAKNYKGDLRGIFLKHRENSFRKGQKEFRNGWLNALEVYRANGCHTHNQDISAGQK